MKRFLFLLSLTLLIILPACDSTEPDDPGAGEEELITRVVLTLTGGGQTLSATADDPDGDGVGIQADTITLQTGTTYTGRIAVFNDLATDAEEQDITAEIRAEADEHQFFYTVGGDAAVQDAVTITLTDQDENGLPVGLDFTVAVAEAGPGTGTLNVVLSHYDDAPKNGTDRSDETDIDVTFPLVVQ